MEKHNINIFLDSTDFPEVRRPKSFPSNEPITNSQDSKENSVTVTNTNNVSSMSDMAKNSKLSVEAKEWYPPGYVSQQTSIAAPTRTITNSSVQNRLNKYRQPDTIIEQNDANNEQDDDIDMDVLNKIIRTLTKNPGEFDYLLYDMMNFLSPYLLKIDVMAKVTSIIFHQALNEPNFQYSAVRLFAVMDDHCSYVRANLHILCETQLSNTANLHNLLIFYAEIFSKLNYELFGKCLLNALQKLKPNAENVKSICQTLKYTGAKLEALDKTLISKIISQLNDLRPSLPSNMSFLVESVIKLRDQNWGQEDVTPPIHNPPAVEPICEWTDEPVFYGPDGRQLTSEETEFLAENLAEHLNLDDDDPDGLWNPEPEMSEEIQAAFTEFVRANR